VLLHEEEPDIEPKNLKLPGKDNSEASEQHNQVNGKKPGPL